MAEGMHELYSGIKPRQFRREARRLTRQHHRAARWLTNAECSLETARNKFTAAVENARVKEVARFGEDDPVAILYQPKVKRAEGRKIDAVAIYLATDEELQAVSRFGAAHVEEFLPEYIEVAKRSMEECGLTYEAPQILEEAVNG